VNKDVPQNPENVDGFKYYLKIALRNINPSLLIGILEKSCCPKNMLHMQIKG